ncbi:MAG: anaerobic ribonucleoside-triphosphate reductase activating protein [Candidatus Verstraetearchaeota archaeon]|nr:anaerobic ribonucleoside-triphosphate reductase activating protein [Candidatus Verstraetearchaeota archaeon]
MSGGSGRSRAGGDGDWVYAPEVLPLSLCDYPGEPAIVVFFSGCNYRCGYCQNWKLRTQEESHRTDLRRILEFLGGSKTVCACKVTGGEPLLQLDPLKRIAARAKSLGLRFGVDTNGTMPERLSEMLPLLDLVSIDIKTSLDDSEYEKVTGVPEPRSRKVVESIRLALSSEAYVDLRMVIIPGVNDAPRIARSVAAKLKELGYDNKADKGEARFTLVEFVPENAGCEEYSKMRNPSVGELKALARLIDLRNVRVTHRALGHSVKLEEIP